MGCPRRREAAFFSACGYQIGACRGGAAIGASAGGHVRRVSAYHRLRPSEERWSFEQRGRIEAALRWYYRSSASYLATAQSLGVSPTSIKRVLVYGAPVTIEIADAVGRAFGMTADQIANGGWSADARRASNE